MKTPRVSRTLKPEGYEPSSFEKETRAQFHSCNDLSMLLDQAPNFTYCPESTAITCGSCVGSSVYRPITYKPLPDDSELVKLRKLSDLKKKLLDHVFDSKVHAISSGSEDG